MEIGIEIDINLNIQSLLYNGAAAAERGCGAAQLLLLSPIAAQIAPLLSCFQRGSFSAVPAIPKCW